MSKLKKILKGFLIILVVILIGIQFVRPALTNPPVDESQTINSQMQMTPEVA